MLKFLLKAGIAAAGVGIALDLLRRREEKNNPEVQDNLNSAREKARDAADAAREAAEAALKAQTAQMKADSQVFADTMSRVKEETIASAEKMRQSTDEFLAELHKATQDAVKEGTEKAQETLEKAEEQTETLADDLKQDTEASVQTAVETAKEAGQALQEQVKEEEAIASRDDAEITEDAKAALTEAEDAAVLAEGGELDLPAPEPVPADEYPEVVDDKENDKKDDKEGE